MSFGVLSLRWMQYARVDESDKGRAEVSQLLPQMALDVENAFNSPTSTGTCRAEEKRAFYYRLNGEAS